MTKHVFAWVQTDTGPALPCGTDKILSGVDGRWSYSTIHRKARDAIRSRWASYKRNGKIIAGYSVGSLDCRGENWASCCIGFTPYTGEE